MPWPARHVEPLFERARRGLHYQGKTRKAVAQKVEELEGLNGPKSVGRALKEGLSAREAFDRFGVM